MAAVAVVTLAALPRATALQLALAALPKAAAQQELWGMPLHSLLRLLRWPSSVRRVALALPSPPVELSASALASLLDLLLLSLLLEAAARSHR